MASAQARQRNKLLEVGHEGFALIDELYGRGTRKSGGRLPVSSQSEQPCVYWGPQVITVKQQPAAAMTMDSDQVAQFYGGRVIVDDDSMRGRSIGRAF